MRLTPISLLVVGAGLAAANPLHVLMASKDTSPIRMGHAAANAGPGANDFSVGQPKPKVRHLCKNMQKAVKGTASRLLALIGIGEHSVSVTAPVPEGGVARIQITTSGPVPHKVGFRPAVQPYPPAPGSPMPGGQGTPIWPHPMYMTQEDRFDGPFLHRAHRALMSLGLWEGRIVAFVLGCGIGVLVRMFFVLTVLFVRAFRGNAISEPEEETTILVYAQEVAPPYEVIDEKKALDADPVVDNRA
jgi:hypothetical protein